MKKVYLTKEQFAEYTKQLIRESIVSEKGSGAFGASKLKKVTDYLAQKAQSAEDNGENDNILQQARENGINISSLKGNLDKVKYDENVKRLVEKLLKEKNKYINDWVKSALPALRSLYMINGEYSSNFQAGKEDVHREQGKLYRDDNGDIELRKNASEFDKLSPSQRRRVMLVRDFLDKEGLTFLYRKVKDESMPKSFKSRYGVDVRNTNWATPVEDLNLDFSNISDGDIKTYYDGTRVKWINDELAKLGYKIPGMTNSDKAIKIKDDNPAWYGQDGKKGLVDIAMAGKLKQAATRYVKRKYGLDFNFGDGDSVFSFGNQKIDKRTIIINFSAALRCPAWNECLLKDACYARTTEKNYDNTFERNLRTNLIWQQTENDETLTNLMLELIRSYIFNYNAAVTAINKTKLKGKYTKESLSLLSMAELRDECPEALSAVAKTKRADVVRLNEDGDFIGQWLVDVWDKWAEDFKLAGVTVAAYTCRALNYEKVKNIILNLSQEGLVRGQNAPAVARYFYAVEPEDYDALKETYGGSVDFKLDPKADHIIPVYQPLIDNDGSIKGYYYKCPCGRGKFTYEEYTPSKKEMKDIQPCTIGEIEGARAGSKKLVSFNGRVYKLIKNEDKNGKVDCYKCRMCYGRSNNDIVTANGEPPQPGLPIYVLVSVHGSNSDNYSADRMLAGKKTSEWVSNQNSIKPAQLSEDMDTAVVNEGENSPLAIKQITKNAVQSVAEHMREMTNSIMEAKNRFNEIYNNISQY